MNTCWVQVMGIYFISTKCMKLNTFKDNIDICLDKCSLFIDTQKSQPLFGFNKKKLCSVKSFLGFMNTLLKEWGLKINSDKYQKKVKINNKWKNRKQQIYSLIYDNNFDRFL